MAESVLKIDSLTSAYDKYNALPSKDIKQREAWLGRHIVQVNREVSEKPKKLYCLYKCCMTKWIYLLINKLKSKHLDIDKMDSGFKAVLLQFQSKFTNFSNQFIQFDPSQKDQLAVAFLALIEEAKNISQSKMLLQAFKAYKYRNNPKAKEKKEAALKGLEEGQLTVDKFSMAHAIVSKAQTKGKNVFMKGNAPFLFVFALPQLGVSTNEVMQFGQRFTDLMVKNKFN